jgi:acyl carrier protein
MTTDAVRATDHGPDQVRAAVFALWRDVLHLDTIGSDDDFFVLGGDSLTAARLATKVSNRFGVDLPPLALYDEAGTPARMTRVVLDLGRW